MLQFLIKPSLLEGTWLFNSTPNFQSDEMGVLASVPGPSN